MATVRELQRMCKSFEECNNCPLYIDGVTQCRPCSFPDDVEKVIDEWVGEHPYDCRAEKIGENIMTELKPCPFCGEKPDDYIKALLNSVQMKIRMYVVCHKCGVEKSTDIRSGAPFERLIEAHEKLIKDWNTRVGE